MPSEMNNRNKEMNIKGSITGIRYKVLLSEDLEEYGIQDLDINNTPSVFLIDNGGSKYAVSKWVSPKRTRSYPFERVYKTLNKSKKITIIPIIKDEGAKGDRDFLQWDTVSLLSLLDVYVIFSYYNSATSHNGKITNQKFDNLHVISKIKEIADYHSSALHWNLNELKGLYPLLEKAKASYAQIALDTKIKMHNEKGIDGLMQRISQNIDEFMQFSRDKAAQAQEREVNTIQPKEALFSNTKSKITITNYLGGKYFLTVDETELKESTLYLIEGKHSKHSKLPSKGDIKDGLLKMILYSNLCDVSVNGESVALQAQLLLTSSKLRGFLFSTSTEEEQSSFFTTNDFSSAQQLFVETLFKEAEVNNFEILIKQSL